MSLVNQAENIPMRLLRICRLKIFQNVVCVLGVWTLAGQSRKQVLDLRNLRHDKWKIVPLILAELAQQPVLCHFLSHTCQYGTVI